MSSIPMRPSPQKLADQRVPTKLQSHEQRLKNCKKVFDQLHRTQIHTFVVRKQHIFQSNPLISKSIKIHQHLPSLQPEQLANNVVKSKSQQKSGKASFRRESMEAVKKMLAINSLQVYNNQSFFKVEFKGTKYPSSILNPNVTTEEDRSDSRAGSRLLRRSEETQLESRSSFMERKKSGKHASRLKHNNSDIQKYSGSTDFNVSNSPKHQPLKINSKSRKKGENLNQNSPKKLATQNRHSLSLESYIKFINSPPSITQLHIHFNFTSIRQMAPSEAWKNLDLKNAKIIQNLLMSIVTSLQSPQNLINSQHIRECCRLYFNNYQKIKLELILKQHYFKLFVFKLNPIFVYQRIILYLCFILCENGCVKNKWYLERLRAGVTLLRNIYTLLLNIVKQIEITKPTVQNIMNLTSEGQVQGTFQILRSVGQTEKYISELIKVVDTMVEGEELQEYAEIQKTLKQYLKEQFYGIGTKTYENFVKAEMLLSWKYLQVPPTPFLPPLKPQYKYTVVLDLDQTLIFYNSQSSTLKFRPSLDLFIKKLMSLQFQIVSFSASSKSYADTIITEIQRKQRIFQYRLYKEHLTLFQGKLVKDLRRLGRDMSKIIIIDDLNVNFSSCKENGIEVSSWQGDKEDNQLLKILQVLTKIDKVENEEIQGNKGGLKDLRRVLKDNKKYLEQMLENDGNIL